MNAEKAPNERQSRAVLGFVKLNAKIRKIAELMTTSVHSPYAGGLRDITIHQLLSRRSPAVAECSRCDS